MKNLLALLADFANGIFAVLMASWFWSVEPAWWFFLIGILLAMSPDIDAIPELLRRGKVSASAEHTHDHRTFLHYPIISIPLGLLAILLFGYWGTVWCIALWLHLINDLYGTGWGLPLFYPISTRNYKFMSRRVNLPNIMLVKRPELKSLPKSETKVNFITAWSRTELSDYIVKYGVDDWIDEMYLTVNPTSLIEYCLFFLALCLLLESILT